MALKRTLEDYYQPKPKKQKLIHTQSPQDDNDAKKQTGKSENCMDITSLKCIENHWKDNATVLYYKTFLSQTRARVLFEELKKLKFEQSELKMFGKSVKVPRLQCWMRDENIQNKDANLYQTNKGYPWSHNMLYVKNSIQKLLDCKFNYVLINYYRDGKDYISWHYDKESRAKCKNIIASVSLGGPRRFVFRHDDWKTKKIPKHEFVLPSGCLVVMKDDTQKKWQHSVPKTTKHQNPRINLTFRQSCDCSVCKGA
eukprot:263549_1